MLEVEGLASAYGRIQVLHGVDFHVKRGEIVTIVGSNGAGKTTLLRALSGVQPVLAGRIRLKGQVIESMAAHQRVRRGMAQVPEGRHVFAPLSVHDNLVLGGWTRPAARRQERLDFAYGLFPALAQRRHQMAGSLSGGQQQMLAIGRALMSEPELLLLDEPSMGLAPVLVDQIFALLPTLKAAGLTILLVEQNAYAALAAADRGYVMETGRIVAGGPAEELLHDPSVREAYLGLAEEAPLLGERAVA
ncbi:MAG: ABC transporter ATP-binding protein [Hydrogenophaga sp.]|uniref:ABC transporter ATP-binding protein n=1 Tax=Hydrogenophaga sp. TaxID=1904254 RepID=UPI00260B2530|nr:ABC transporter ATP-binding protein [Hydrogenophaga sp.]MCW5668690.1 ABC transporter ATP-binding protein [Hydrogenophaga sp.]